MKYSTSRKENVLWLVSVQFALKISKHSPTTQEDFSLLSHSQLGCVWSTAFTSELGKANLRAEHQQHCKGRFWIIQLTSMHWKLHLELFWLVSVPRKDSLSPLGQALWGWLISAAAQSTLHCQVKSSLTNFDTPQLVQITRAAQTSVCYPKDVQDHLDIFASGLWLHPLFLSLLPPIITLVGSGWETKFTESPCAHP